MTHIYWIPWWLRGEEFVCNAGDMDSIPQLGRFSGEGNGNPLQYSCLENPTDGEAWCPWGCKELDMTERLHFTLAKPLDCKEIQPVPSKGDQPWVFFGRNDAKAETPVLWPPHVKN